jgi:NADH dehydrogenase
VETDNQVGLKIRYDYLILATGANHSYFGHDEFAAFAPGLKSLADAEGLRNRILEVVEKAEIEDDPQRRRALMTLVMVGAGPTGVEIASAIAVMARTTLRRDFRRIDPTSAHIILVDVGARPLATFSEKLSEAAMRRLTRLGVDVRFGVAVQMIDGKGVVMGNERVRAKTVVLTLGAAPSTAGKWLGTVWTARAACGLSQILQFPNTRISLLLETRHRSIKTATRYLESRKLRCSKASMRRCLSFGESPDALHCLRIAILTKEILLLWEEFRGPTKCWSSVERLMAWLIWAFVHIQLLAKDNLRFSVFLQWVWTYISGSHAGRPFPNLLSFNSGTIVSLIHLAYSTPPLVLADYQFGSNFFDHGPIAIRLSIALPFAHDDRSHFTPSSSSGRRHFSPECIARPDGSGGHMHAMFQFR